VLIHRWKAVRRGANCDECYDTRAFTEEKKKQISCERLAELPTGCLEGVWFVEAPFARLKAPAERRIAR
jgi:hypothetical protein